MSQYLVNLYAEKSETSRRKLAASLIFLDALRAQNWAWDIVTQEAGNRVTSAPNFAPFRGFLDLNEMISALATTKPVFFDSYAWDRRNDADEL